MSDTLIVIPCRMDSTRLPGKPLLKFNGIPMVIRIAKIAISSGLGDVVIACCDSEVYDVAKKYKINAIMTSKIHKSGSDRVFEALEMVDSKKNISNVINLQGDMPTVSKNMLKKLLYYKINSDCEIATLAAKIIEKEEESDSNVVKVVFSNYSDKKGGKALYFSRSSIPFGSGSLFHHVGLYCYSRESLEIFVNLKQSKLELLESLEQLRALEAGMNIFVGKINEVPIGVDNFSDYEKAVAYVHRHG